MDEKFSDGGKRPVVDLAGRTVVDGMGAELQMKSARAAC